MDHLEAEKKNGRMLLSISGGGPSSFGRFRFVDRSINTAYSAKKENHGEISELQEVQVQAAKTCQGQNPRQKEGSDHGRWRTAATNVRRLQKRRVAQKINQSTGKNSQSPKERVFRCKPTCRCRRHQTGTVYGTVAVCRRLSEECKV